MSNLISIRFFDPEHGPGSDILLLVNEEDAEAIQEFEKIETRLDLPSLPGMMVKKHDGRVIFTHFKGERQARSYTCSSAELAESLNNPENRIPDE